MTIYCEEEEMRDCGHKWAEREYDAADELDADGHNVLDRRRDDRWHASVNDALSLVDDTLDPDERYRLAEIAHDAAAARWAQLISEHVCDACESADLDELEEGELEEG